MHFRLIPQKRKAGNYVYAAQVVLPKRDFGERIQVNVGTFDKPERAAVAAKIFIHWMTYYPKENFLRFATPRMKDAI